MYHAMRMRHVVICGLYSCTVLFHTILVYVLPTQCIYVLCVDLENKQRFPYTELTVFCTHFSYIKDV